MKTNKEMNEGVSKYLSQMRSLLKDSENILGYASQLVGAVGGNELDQMVSGSLSAAANLIAFSIYFLSDGTVSKDAVIGNYNKVVKILNKLQVVEAKSCVSEIEDDSEIFIDPYESEYLPESLLSAVSCKQEINEGVNDSLDLLPDDLDDDPDALYTLEDGIPAKFNNSPVELDPFAVKLFKNNADLIDPPEVFSADGSAEIKPVDQSEVPSEITTDQVIDAIADIDDTKEVSMEEKPDEEKLDDEVSDVSVASVDLPSSDFDVFANEAKAVPQVKVTPKTQDSVLPPQFSQTELKRANENIADVPGNNLKMLSFLTQDW